MNKPTGYLALVVSLASAGVASAAPVLRDVMHVVTRDPAVPVPDQVNSHTLFLNPCTGGCVVHSGQTDSTTSTSDIGSGTLAAFPYGDTVWNDTVACVTRIMAPFNIQVVTTKPSGDFFEVMIAGNSCDILDQSECSGVGGIADYPCQGPGDCFESYIPDALVFDFATSIGNDANYLCGVAAQEIAHAWTLDHTIETTDPMTYNGYAANLTYANGAKCGSDCLYSCPSGSGTCDAFGAKCTGSGGQAVHACLSSGTATQDEVTIITGLFGPSSTNPPVVKITSPSNGASVGQGFPVDVTCTNSDGVMSVALAIDDLAPTTLTTSPYTFSTPTTLPVGPHTVTATCTTTLNATAMASVSVTVANKCTKNSDCTTTGDICYEGACIAGPNAQGGLGTVCTNNSMCASDSCTSDGTNSYCVVPCDLTHDQCPSGYGCLADGSGGVCWPGVSNGSSGGCNTGRDSTAPITLALGVAALLITRRKRR